MPYSRQKDIPYSGLSGYTEQVWLIVILSNYRTNQFRRFYSHVCCVESQNWPYDIAFSQDGGSTFKNYIRLALTSHLLVCLVPIDGFDDGVMTVYWGDASASDYADNTDVLYVTNVELQQTALELPYITTSISDGISLSPPFIAFSAIASNTNSRTYWTFTADDGFYVRFSAHYTQIGVDLNGSTSYKYPQPYRPELKAPWFLVMKALTDSVSIQARTVQGLYSTSKSGDLSSKTFTSFSLNHPNDEEKHLNTWVVTARNVHWPDVGISFGDFVIESPNLFLEDELYPQTRRYWLFSGYATEGGSPVQNDVYIVDHKTGVKERLKSRPSDGYWEYRITRFHQQLRGGNWMSRDMTSEEMDKRFAVFCHDPDQVYNAKIYDHLTPVLVEIED